MNSIERTLRRIDAFQQSHQPLTTIYAVIKKFGDDNSGTLVSSLAYSGFVAVFPLLLVAVTALGIVLGGHPGLAGSVQRSILSQFPVIGTELLHNIHALHSATAVSLVVGLLGLLWGSLGLAQAGIFAMEQVWNIPGANRPNYLTRLGRSVAFLGVLAVGVLAGALLAGFGTFGGHAIWVRVAGVAASLAVNVGQFWLAFRVLTPKSVAHRELVPGALFGGAAWTVVQAAAGYLVGHNLRHDSAVYGMFAIVLGLLAYIYLGARLAVYSAELNVVWHERLWPRALVQPPLTPADQASLARQALENRRRPEQQVRVSFTEPPRLGSDPEPADPDRSAMER